MTKLEELIKELCPNGVEFVALQKVVDLHKGVQFNRKDMGKTGAYPVINGGIEPSGFIEQFNERENTITISQGGASAGYVNWQTTKFWAGAHCYVIRPWKDQVLNNRYLYHFIKSKEKELQACQYGAGIPALGKDTILNLQIPLPPIGVQSEIVRILDDFTLLSSELAAELAARRKQYEYYRDKLLSFDKLNARCAVNWLNAEEIFEIRNGYTPSKSNVDFWEDGTIPWFRLDDIRAQGRNLYSAFQNVTLEAVKGKKLIPKYSLILSTTATIGEHAIVEVDCLTNQQMTAFTLKEEYKNIISIKFLFYCFFKYGEWCRANVNKGGGLPIINSATLKKYCFPVPPLEVQAEIVETLDEFDKLCNDLSGGLPAEIQARQKQYEYYRDKLLTFEPNK